MPTEVADALTHLLVALIAWWLPAPRRERRKDDRRAKHGIWWR